MSEREEEGDAMARSSSLWRLALAWAFPIVVLAAAEGCISGGRREADSEAYHAARAYLLSGSRDAALERRLRDSGERLMHAMALLIELRDARLPYNKGYGADLVGRADYPDRVGAILRELMGQDMREPALFAAEWFLRHAGLDGCDEPMRITALDVIEVMGDELTLKILEGRALETTRTSDRKEDVIKSIRSRMGRQGQ